MKSAFLTLAMLTMLVGCTPADTTDEDLSACAPCGNGCIPSNELPFTLCQETTEDFECVLDNDVCVRKD